MRETVVEIGPGSSGARRALALRSERGPLRRIGGIDLDRGVPLLDEDRSLAATAPLPHVAALRQLLRVDVLNLGAGAWDPAAAPIEADGALGLLVLDGFFTRCQSLEGRSSAEPLGPGDLLRPWDCGDEYSTCVRTDASWQVCEPARVALLDARAAAAVGRSPMLTSELMSRLVRRNRLLATLLALTQIRQLRRRLLLALWSLADRWGRVTPDGVALTVPLRHETIAQLAGASRPSVTSSLAELRADGLVRPAKNHSWVLLGGPPVERGSGLH